MASFADQMSANLSFSAFSKAEDLKKRLWFTLGALLVYRLGTYIPIPGIDATAMADLARQHSTGILGFFDRFSGGALGRMTIFALGVMPYISASIIMQLLTVISPQLEAIKKEGESGRKKINQYTRYGTVALALIQSYLLSVGLESMNTFTGEVVPHAGFFFRIVAVVTLVSGTMFLLWLGDQITARGVGNGVSLLIFAGIVANLPHAIVSTLELGRTGALSPLLIIGVLVAVLGFITFIVFMERAQRRVMIQYPKRQVGMRIMEGQSSHLPIKVNSAGVIPPIFANSLLSIPLTIVGFAAQKGSSSLSSYASYLTSGQLWYYVLLVGLIMFFAFFYTAIIFNPEETAENLKKNGAFVPGYRPGTDTAKHFDYILSRLTVAGSIYLAGVSILPEILVSKLNLPFYLGGTSLLIVVGVSMDTITQIQSHLLAHQYENLLKKSRLKGLK